MINKLIKIDVSYEQLAHDLAMMKLNKKFNNGHLKTYGDMLEKYLDELDTCKSLLKSTYGEDIFTK